MLYIDIHIFLACRRACSSTECPPWSFICEQYWLRYGFVCTSEIVENPFFNVLFWINFFWFLRVDASLVLFPCLVLVRISEWYDWLIWLFYSIIFLFFPIDFDSQCLQLRWIREAVVWVCMLCVAFVTSVLLTVQSWLDVAYCSQIHFSSLPMTFSLILIPLLPAACIYCIHWPNIFSLSASAVIYLLLLRLYVTEMSLQLGRAC